MQEHVSESIEPPTNPQFLNSSENVKCSLHNLRNIRKDLSNLKMEALEANCAKKDLEIENFKREINGRKNLENQLSGLKQELTVFIEAKLKALEEELIGNGT
jgi:hypothetical protein